MKTRLRFYKRDKTLLKIQNWTTDIRPTRHKYVPPTPFFSASITFVHYDLAKYMNMAITRFKL